MLNKIIKMKLQIGFDDPVMAVCPRALEEKCVRPRAPVFFRVEMSLRAADGLVHGGRADAQADAPRLRVAFEKFAVRKSGDDDGLVVHVRGWFNRARQAKQGGGSI